MLSCITVNNLYPCAGCPATLEYLALKKQTDPHIQPFSPVRGIWKKKWRFTNSNKLREVTEDLTPLPNSVCSNRRKKALARLRIGQKSLNARAPLIIKHILLYRHCASYTLIGLPYLWNRCCRRVTPPLVEPSIVCPGDWCPE